MSLVTAAVTVVLEMNRLGRACDRTGPGRAARARAGAPHGASHANGLGSKEAPCVQHSSQHERSESESLAVSSGLSPRAAAGGPYRDRR